MTLIQGINIKERQTKRGKFDSEFCHVQYMEGSNLVLLTWKKFCRHDDYKEPTLFALELLKRHKNTDLVIDARNGFEDEKEDVEWAFSTLLPDMSKTDCKNVVLIMKETHDIEDEMDMWAKEFKKYFTVHRVASCHNVISLVEPKQVN
ncbi:MAG: hypothetical protein FWG14_12485 [Peptococcaceae bacterium]|nr:hypothetical protein [Peptococcaceae bacterium]